jgi:hypothetical protein
MDIEFNSRVLLIAREESLKDLGALTRKISTNKADPTATMLAEILMRLT